MKKKERIQSKDTIFENPKIYVSEGQQPVKRVAGAAGTRVFFFVFKRNSHAIYIINTWTGSQMKSFDVRNVYFRLCVFVSIFEFLSVHLWVNPVSNRTFVHT